MSQCNGMKNVSIHEYKQWKTIQHDNITFRYVSLNLASLFVGWLNQSKDRYGFQVCMPMHIAHQKEDAPQHVSYQRQVTY